MLKRERAFSRALSYLHEMITKAVKDGERILPDTASLAAGVPVAYATMWKAVNRLVRDGVLEARPRRGITILNRSIKSNIHNQSTVVLRHASLKWKRLQISIEQDILSGVYGEGVLLPSRKELENRYGVCRQTLYKVLTQLSAKKTLLASRSHYLVPGMQIRNREKLLVLVASGDANGNIDVTKTRTADSLRCLDHECSRAEIPLVAVAFDDSTGILHIPDRLRHVTPGNASGILGIMIWQSGIDHHPWTDLVIRFGSWGKPMALLDENGSWRLSFPAGGRNRIRHFALAYPETAGLAMGRYLLRKGHRRIAYISPVHGSAWSVNRLKGLRRAFEEAGFMKAISAFTHDEFLLPADILEQQQNLRASIQMLLSKGEKSAVWSATARRALLKLHSKAAIVLEGEVYRERMVPLMEHALEHDDITAWVAADDETALKCLDFLEESRLKVPEKIAVVGFDDSIESCTRKLTTYDFNTPAYIRAMINHIIVPQRSVPSVNRRTEIEIGGSVIVRETA